MKKAELSIPELALIAGTRGMLGAGVGLLVADYLPPKYRRTVGWSLLAIGALSTVPLALHVFGKARAGGRKQLQPVAATRVRRRGRLSSAEPA